MLEIAKESLAPHHYETLRQAHRPNTEGLIPEIVSVFFFAEESASESDSKKSQPKQR